MNHNDFDIREYIRKRMLEITNLDDRKAFKEVVGDLLVELYEYNKTSYQELEKRILDEYNSTQRDYAIDISLTDMLHYDATDPIMHPILIRDTKSAKIPFSDVVSALKKKEKLKLYTVFLEVDVSAIYRIIHENRLFYGVIKTNRREYRATFEVVRNTEYMDLIKELYDIFGANYQSWSTVCEAYLTKMFDVNLCKSELIKDTDEILEIQIDFEEYTSQVRYDMIPLWNLQTITEKTSTYPNPSIDKANYEHQIFSHRLKAGCEYLIRNTDVEITNIRRLNGDLFISCPVDKPCEWHLYQVNKLKGTARYPYPVLSNQYKESFAGNIVEVYRKSVKTKGELARLIEAFDYRSYVIFQEVNILESVPEDCMISSYNMDGFIEDEIRVGNSSQALVIDFAAVDPMNFLNEDIMSFLVTQVQKIFPEYRCVGRLV